VATNVKSGTGSKLYVSSALPATETKAGYTALTWVLVGDTIEIGEYGVEYTIIEHNPIDSAVTQKIKGNASYGSLASKIGSVPADAGQVIMLAAAKSDNNYSFKIEKTDGGIDAFTGRVTKAKPTVNSGAIISVAANVAINTEIIDIK
jgi:hypothetical protein